MLKKLLLILLVVGFIGCATGPQARYDQMVGIYNHHYHHPDSVRVDDYQDILVETVKPPLDKAGEALVQGDMYKFEKFLKKAKYAFYDLEWKVFDFDPWGGGGG